MIEGLLPMLSAKRQSMTDKLLSRLTSYWQSADTLGQGLGRSFDRRLREMTDPYDPHYNHQIEKRTINGIINYKLK